MLSTMISIIIPTFNNPYRLRSCLKAVKSHARYKNYEVILVDNNNTDKKSLAVINACGHRVIRYSYKFNFGKINNFASKYAKGEYLLFLNDNTIPVKNWLVPMLSECQREDAGIVSGIDKKSPAVTGACLMIKKKLFEEAGGFDENYWLGLQDVDLCFKIKKLGLKVIYTPYSIVYHKDKVAGACVSKAASLYDSLRLRKKWFNNDKCSKHKILLIKLLTLGDVIIATAIIEAVRKKYPQAEIVFATSHQYADIIKGNPYLDRVHLCRNYRQDEFGNELTYYKALTLELLEQENWDLVYQLQVLDLSCGHWKTDYHLRELYADLANVKIKDERAYIPLTGLEKSKVKSILNASAVNAQKIILMHTTSGWKLKDWDLQKYPLLIKKIQANYAAAIFQVGGPKDTVIEDKTVVHLEGKLTLKETAALMEYSDLLICPDSGPMHMASAARLATVALFGPTNSAKVGPVNGDRFICVRGNANCGTPCHMNECYLLNACTKAIPVDLVFNAITKLLGAPVQCGSSCLRIRTLL